MKELLLTLLLFFTSSASAELILTPLRPELKTAKVIAFLNALSSHKAELRALYRVSGAEYNLLAHMAVGILGRESQFFQSRRYMVKENLPWAVHLTKVIQIYLEGSDRPVSPNSRGPTQIKIVPAKIADYYGITENDLFLPENAAVATMGFLIEALAELKRRVVVNHLDFVTPETYVDYLPYIYFGATRLLISGQATPERNIYVRDMKRYMSWVSVEETEPERLSSAP
jgi:hypothetical protein